jgi:hypothetical protein
MLFKPSFVTKKVTAKSQAKLKLKDGNLYYKTF